VPWADLLKKVFALDVLARPECSGRMQLIAFIAAAAIARRILDHLGLDSTGPPVARAEDRPEAFDPGPDYSHPGAHRWPHRKGRASLIVAITSLAFGLYLNSACTGAPVACINGAGLSERTCRDIVGARDSPRAPIESP
jgi:hypothetical protein